MTRSLGLAPLLVPTLLCVAQLSVAHTDVTLTSANGFTPRHITVDLYGDYDVNFIWPNPATSGIVNATVLQTATNTSCVGNGGFSINKTAPANYVLPMNLPNLGVGTFFYAMAERCASDPVKFHGSITVVDSTPATSTSTSSGSSVNCNAQFDDCSTCVANAACEWVSNGIAEACSRKTSTPNPDATTECGSSSSASALQQQRLLPPLLAAATALLASRAMSV